MTRVYLSAPDVGPLEREYLLRAFDSGCMTTRALGTADAAVASESGLS